MTTPASDHADAARFWEAHHERQVIARGPRANARLVEIVADLTPGTALDLGCGPVATRSGWLDGAGGSPPSTSPAARGRGAGREGDQDPGTRFRSPQEIAAGLELDPAGWTVERAEATSRTATGPGGRTAEVVDHVLLVRRTG